MRSIKVNNRTITVDNKTMKTTWTQELADDLKKFHDIEFKEVASVMIVEELNRECPLTENEKSKALEIIQAELT